MHARSRMNRLPTKKVISFCFYSVLLGPFEEGRKHYVLFKCAFEPCELVCRAFVLLPRRCGLLDQCGTGDLAA